jgi:hypothetical protein
MTPYNFLTKKIERKIKLFNSKNIEKITTKSNNLEEFYGFIKNTTESQKSIVMIFNTNEGLTLESEVIVSKFSDHHFSIC